MNVELRYLHAFRTVCEAGGLRAAAAVLHRTEQSVSYQLRRLEESLGMPLFERRGGRLHPNAAGLRLLDFCRGMEHDWERVQQDMLGSTTQKYEPLRISSVRGYGQYVVRPLFRPGGALTHLPVRIQYPTFDGVMHNVESGESDLGFVFSLPVHTRMGHMAIDSEEIVLISPASDPPPDLNMGALENQTFVSYDESDFVFATWFGHVFGRPTPQLSVAAHFEEMEEVVNGVAAGYGISILPAACLLGHDMLPGIRILEDPAAICRNTIYAVFNAPPSHPDVERVLDALRALASQRLPGTDRAATSDGSS
ncbi:LysR family transcriptional regulator [Dyella sp.]|uniref:LysR family transcriptional regulator n=1 Tax=Dyella sp. TaxID=1869338 RepID=UPI002ED49BB0